MHLADKTLERAAMRHPMVRKNIDPHEILHALREIIEGQHLENDRRFMYSMTEGENTLSFTVKV